MAMFQKENSNSHSGKAQTVIGPSVKIEGDLHGVGDIIVQGTIIGTLSTDQNITIEESAYVKANVKGKNIQISGKVEGSVMSQEHLSLSSKAFLEGEVETLTISIESGAHMNGPLKMGAVSSVTSKEKPLPNKE